MTQKYNSKKFKNYKKYEMKKCKLIQLNPVLHMKLY